MDPLGLPRKIVGIAVIITNNGTSSISVTGFSALLTGDASGEFVVGATLFDVNTKTNLPTEPVKGSITVNTLVNIDAAGIPQQVDFSVVTAKWSVIEPGTTYAVVLTCGSF